MMLRQCIAKGCASGIPTQRLMCRVHWFMVPTELRRILQKAPRASRVHTVALEKAITAVEELETQSRILWSGKLGES